MAPLEGLTHLRLLIKGRHKILTDQATESPQQRATYILDRLMEQGMILL